MTIKVALVGVGNVASALVQGVEMDRGQPSRMLSLLSQTAGASLAAIRFAVAFDVDQRKVGIDLGTAIFAGANNTVTVHQPGMLGAPVLRGPVLDGLDSALAAHVPVDHGRPVADVARELRSRGIGVVVILLPTGANEAALHYAHAALEAGCAVVNGMPATIANDAALVGRARSLGLPLIGDDIKSQVGATVIHRALANLFPARGATLDRTLQLDWGGDMDFCNLVSNDRYERGKRQSKTESVVAHLPNRESVDCHIAAVSYIPFLENRKEAYTRLEGRIFGGLPVRIDVNMQVVDGYNSAGMLVDAIRIAGLALDRRVAGTLDAACAWFCKRPPVQMDDHEARAALLDFVAAARTSPKL